MEQAYATRDGNGGQTPFASKWGLTPFLESVPHLRRENLTVPRRHPAIPVVPQQTPTHARRADNKEQGCPNRTAPRTGIARSPRFSCSPRHTPSPTAKPAP